jgi:hypothetical protein
MKFITDDRRGVLLTSTLMSSEDSSIFSHKKLIRLIVNLTPAVRIALKSTTKKLMIFIGVLISDTFVQFCNYNGLSTNVVQLGLVVVQSKLTFNLFV